MASGKGRARKGPGKASAQQGSGKAKRWKSAEPYVAVALAALGAGALAAGLLRAWQAGLTNGAVTLIAVAAASLVAGLMLQRRRPHRGTVEAGATEREDTPGSRPTSGASSWKPEGVQFTIAMVVVLGGGALIWAVVMPYITSPTLERGLDPAIIITPVFSLIGGVTGYYFGAKGTYRALDAAHDASQQVDKAREVATKLVSKVESWGRRHRRAAIQAAAMDQGEPDVDGLLAEIQREMDSLRQL